MKMFIILSFFILVVLIGLVFVYNQKSTNLDVSLNKDLPQPILQDFCGTENTVGQNDNLKAVENRKKIDLDDWKLTLVNYDHPLPKNWKVETEIYKKYPVDVRILPDLKSLADAAKRDGILVELCSSYRSVEYQTESFERKTQSLIEKEGLCREKAEEKVQRRLAKPGHSEHNAGLAVDFYTPENPSLSDDFEKTKLAIWLKNNAIRFGFILRYPRDKTNITLIDYEPWHYRYVGRENADKIEKSGLCLEEYLLKV